MKIRTVGAKLFHADRQTHGQTRQTDITKLIVAFFYNSANVPKNSPQKLKSCSMTTTKGHFQNIFFLVLQQFRNTFNERIIVKQINKITLN